VVTARRPGRWLSPRAHETDPVRAEDGLQREGDIGRVALAERQPDQRRIEQEAVRRRAHAPRSSSPPTRSAITLRLVDQPDLVTVIQVPASKTSLAGVSSLLAGTSRQ
jgi:hypothetical protein